MTAIIDELTESPYFDFEFVNGVLSSPRFKGFKLWLWFGQLIVVSPEDLGKKAEDLHRHNRKEFLHLNNSIKLPIMAFVRENI